MRVIAGRLRGRRIEAPRGSRVRPTYDRVRASVFDILGPDVEGARVLDLFAGSGALGIECISRGAGSVIFVEMDRDVATVLRANLESLGVSGSAVVVRGDALRLLAGAVPGGPFDIVFVDPPYGKGLEGAVLRRLSSWQGLAPGARVLVEHASGDEPGPEHGPLVLERRERYGSTEVDFLRARRVGGKEAL